MKLDAIILAAGSGSRMAELTRGRPKCLLPVGNQSLIWFAITGLRSIGVTRIIILVPDIHEQDIRQYCIKKFNSHKDLALEFLTVPMEADCGTAESILQARDKIKGDFIVYSCDSIVEPKALSALLNHYRLYDPMLSMLLSDNPAYFQTRSVPGRREKEHYMRDVIAFEPLGNLDLTASYGISTNKVVFLHSERDLSKNLRIKNRELALHPSLEVGSQFLDTHVYIFKRQVLELMAQNKDKAVLKGEMIPLLISKQFTKLEADSFVDEDDEDTEILRPSGQSDHENELRDRLENLNPCNVVRADYLQKPRLPRPSACHCLIAKNIVAYRINTLGCYLDANKDSRNILSVYGAKSVKSTRDCVVAEDTKMGEKLLLKGGSVGNNCRIGDKVKLIGCTVMDNVEIESNVNLTDCIIGSNSKIGTKCDLKSCIVGSKQTVAGSRKANSEVIIDDGYVIDLSHPLESDINRDL